MLTLSFTTGLLASSDDYYLTRGAAGSMVMMETTTNLFSLYTYVRTSYSTFYTFYHLRL